VADVAAAGPGIAAVASWTSVGAVSPRQKWGPGLTGARRGATIPAPFVTHPSVFAPAHPFLVLTGLNALRRGPGNTPMRLIRVRTI
jgi:hypothetical protein